MSSTSHCDASETPLDKFHNLLFGVRRSIRYHNRRRLFFDRIHKISTFLSALTGTATFAAVIAKAGHTWTLLFAVSVAVFSTVDLVLNTGESARLHHDLARKFFELEESMIRCKDPSDEDVKTFTARRLQIEAEEPPVLKVLDAICHNELVRALGYPDTYYARLTWYQRIFAHFFDLREHKIQPWTQRS